MDNVARWDFIYEYGWRGFSVKPCAIVEPHKTPDGPYESKEDCIKAMRSFIESHIGQVVDNIPKVRGTAFEKRLKKYGLMDELDFFYALQDLVESKKK